MKQQSQRFSDRERKALQDAFSYAALKYGPLASREREEYVAQTYRTLLAQRGGGVK